MRVRVSWLGLGLGLGYLTLTLNPNPNPSPNQVGEWQRFMRRHGLSHAAWAVSDKAEAASIFVPGAAAALGAWGEEHLTESGRCVREVVRGSVTVCAA